MSESLAVVRNLSQTPGSLLDLYQPESSVYFSSEKHALLARPPFASLLVAGMKDLDQQVRESLRLANELGFEKTVVVGAIPFDVNEKSYLRVSTNLLTENNRRSSSAANESIDIGHYSINSHPEPNEYINGVKNALQRFDRGELDKVVLSRTLEIDCEHSPNVKTMVRNLASKNAHGYTFAVNLKDIDNHSQDNRVHALIGASPELLISRRGSKIIANPLAGSEPRSQDSTIDRERAQRLLASPKDRHEHALVIQAIEKVLRPYCRTLHVPTEPSMISTEAMWHLSTRIEGELKDPAASSLALALALHPTPAVCGHPNEEARNAIKQIEQHERDLFTGMVGWCDNSGDGEWVVTIRCAEVEAKKIRLYAGAGIVEGSEPEKELAETGAKFNTMLNAIGL